jgi:HD-GYP domain-containing protein (c-di-GMP phosphodiesterase class II)
MNILRQHHERYDGAGYPYGLKDDQISLEGAIIQIADSWDAMTSQRVYHHEMTLDEALDELRRSSGHQFNPKVVDVFVKMIQEEGLVDLEETPSE